MGSFCCGGELGSNESKAHKEADTKRNGENWVLEEIIEYKEINEELKFSVKNNEKNKQKSEDYSKKTQSSEKKEMDLAEKEKPLENMIQELIQKKNNSSKREAQIYYNANQLNNQSLVIKKFDYTIQNPKSLI